MSEQTNTVFQTFKAQMVFPNPSHPNNINQLAQPSNDDDSYSLIATTSEDGKDSNSYPKPIKRKKMSPLIETPTSISDFQNSFSIGSVNNMALNFYHQSHKPKKKREVIIDNQGIFDYYSNPIEYMKARKRKQNRESAVRSRNRKKDFQVQLEKIINDLTEENQQLKIDNASLVAENNLLKRQVTYFENLLSKSTTAPSESKHTDSASNSVLHQELDPLSGPTQKQIQPPKNESQENIFNPHSSFLMESNHLDLKINHNLSELDFSKEENNNKLDEGPIFSDYDDSDMIFYGLSKEKSPSFSKNLLIFTIMLGIFSFASILFNTVDYSILATPDFLGGGSDSRKLNAITNKTISESELAQNVQSSSFLYLLFLFLISPKLLFGVYFFFTMALILSKTKIWMRTNKRISKYIRKRAHKKKH